MSTEITREVLERRIARERDALVEALDDARERARTELSLGRRVREHPSRWIAGALLAGLWLGARR
jgi:hypothetical protein